MGKFAVLVIEIWMLFDFCLLGFVIYCVILNEENLATCCKYVIMGREK